eukprot:GEMP01050396.1.p1 GENE.GEMP01050396.1~~GEMP01050396.1.p1  ORF type:complete len:370 (+),score=87.16 GEMP01050396.1:96-1205(+)
MEGIIYLRTDVDENSNLSLMLRPSSDASAFTASSISSARGIPSPYCGVPTLEALRCIGGTVDIPLFDDLMLTLRTSTASTASYVDVSQELEEDDATDATNLQYQPKSTMEVRTLDLDGWLVDDDASQDNAAVVLQKHARRKAAQKNVSEKREAMQRASTTIQSVFRGSTLRKRMSAATSAVVRVQSYFRGWKCRCILNQKRQTEHEETDEHFALEYHQDDQAKQGRTILPPIGISAPTVQRKKRRKREVVIVDHHHVHHHHHFHHHHQAVAEVPKLELEQQAVDLSLKPGLEHAAVCCDIFPHGERIRRQLPLGATEYYGQIAKMNATTRLHYSPYAFASDLRARRGASGFYTRVVKRSFATTLPPIGA